MMSDLAKRLAGLSAEQRKVLARKLNESGLQVPSGRIAKKASGEFCLPSLNQQWLWMVDRLTGGNPAWNVFAGAHLKGPLHARLIERSLNLILARHDALRTSLMQKDERLVQKIMPRAEVELNIVDLQEMPPEHRAAAAQQQIGERYRQLFDLSTAPLFRPTLFRLSEQEHALLVVMHHTITDWISFMVFHRELAQAYNALLADSRPVWPELPIQYADYAIWENEWLQSAAAQSQLGYWQKQLAGAPALTTLPADHPRPAVRTYWGARKHFALTAELSERLRALSLEQGATLFMMLIASFYVLLYCHTRQDEMIIGTPVIGRQQIETEPLIGLFLNHLSLRVSLAGNPTFRELLQRIRRVVLEGYANQQMPFGHLVKQLWRRPETDRNPFFQTMFFFLTPPPVQQFADLTSYPYEAYGGTARYDLLLSLWDRPEAISGFFEYNTSLYLGPTIQQAIDGIQAILSKVAENLDRRLTELL